MSVGDLRSPVRPLEVTDVTKAYPGELLIDPNTGNFTYLPISGGQVIHNKPGTLTVKQGSNTLLNAGDLSTALEFTIPDVQLPTLTANRAMVSDGDGNMSVSAVTSTELSYLSGATSSIQDQLDNKAPMTHSHNYVPTTGGTISGALTPSGNNTIDLGSASAAFRYVYATTFVGNLSGNANTATSAGMADVLSNSRTFTIGNTAKYFNGSGNVSWTLSEIGAAAADHTHSGYLSTSGGTISGALTPSGNSTIDLGTSSLRFRNIYATTFTGSLSGNATTATSAATLTTARTLTIGNTGKSFNGGANVTWTLSEIGAAATNHTHSEYLGASGGTITGTLNISGTLNVTGTAKGIMKTYSGTLSTSWSGSKAPYSQAVTVSGILATDRPILDYTNSGTYATDQNREEGWLNIYRAVTAANKITFYAHEKPTVSIPFTAQVVR